MKLFRFKRKELLGVLYIVVAYFLAILVALNYFAFMYASLIDGFFHQSSYKVVDDGTGTSDTDYQLDYTSISDLEVDERAYAEQVQSEGVILLQNKNLPQAPCKTTFLGLYSRDDMLSAGVSVSDNAPTMQKQFEDAGFTVNTTMIDYYKSISEEANPADFSAAAKSSVVSYNDLGIVVLFSGGAESRDITVDDLRFTDTEKALIQYASENFKNVVVLLNTSNTVECGYLEGFDNVSVMYINFAGDAGIGVIPKLITGELTPSGKTADTFAYDVEYPISMLNYENSAEDQALLSNGEAVGNYVNYTEGIYVGYRYFETRYEDVVLGQGNAGDFDYAATVQYPFGYGLSYTTFDYSDFTMQENPDSFTLSVKVTNTGDTYSGKEAVGFYMQSPYTDYDKQNHVEKAAVQLVDFAKTSELAPGASETLTVEVSKSEMRAYDANNAKTYIVDDGKYYFAAGANSHDAINNILAAKAAAGAAVDTAKMTDAGDASLVSTYTQETFDAETYSIGANGEKITNQFDNVNMNYYYDGITYVSRQDWAGTIPAEKAGAIDAAPALLADFNPTFESTGAAAPAMGQNNGLSVASLKGVDYDNEYWNQLLDQLTADELMSTVAYGGFKTPMLTSINKPASVDKDGPAGLDSSQLGGASCYLFPSESMLACTWNKDLVAQLGYYVSQDCLLTGTTGWYAPACNIHRIAICGRTREYFSEDAYLSGAMAYAIASTAQSHGVVTYTKHFALNEQENNRSSVCTFSNEQAIREIYLKPFEMSVGTEGGGMGIMTSMNRVGAVYSSSDYALCTGVLRNEWGFHGVVITDFVSGPNDKIVPREMVLAGTDLFLCTLSDQSMFIDGYAKDADVLNALRESAHRICYTYVNSNVMNGLSSSTRVINVTPGWKYGLYAVDAVVVYLLYLLAMSPILSADDKEDKKKGKKEQQA